MLFLPLLLSGVLALGAGTVGGKPENSCNLMEFIKSTQGSLPEQFAQLKNKVAKYETLLETIIEEDRAA